ncbi:hypothetical protein [Acaryochloris sp. IP29b_bin.148]|uniref:hypothetical protein n=1 Tax=Acaryochloris sp. IP29b_bin.148 TaxID=2969218 RepID=UPI002610CBBA|nr:hypothetical protein [Acaryochloris sp. IP29b_bin.148]
MAYQVVKEEFDHLEAQRQRLLYWLKFERLDLQQLNHQLQQSPLSEVATLQEEIIYFGS